MSHDQRGIQLTAGAWTRPPDPITPADRAGVVAWSAAWAALTPEQQAAWARTTAARAGPVEPFDRRAGLTELMEAKPINTYFGERMATGSRVRHYHRKDLTVNWTKTKIWRWTAGAYRITDDPGPDTDAHPFRLETFADPVGKCFTLGDPQNFGSLDEAKAAAALKNELALARADNERLRAELAEARGGPASSAQSVSVDAIAGKLFQVMSRNAAPALRGAFCRVDARIGGANGNGRDAEADTEKDYSVPDCNGTADGFEMPF